MIAEDFAAIRAAMRDRAPAAVVDDLPRRLSAIPGHPWHDAQWLGTELMVLLDGEPVHMVVTYDAGAGWIENAAGERLRGAVTVRHLTPAERRGEGPLS